MDTIQFEDTLEPLGLVSGALLVLFALGWFVGQPWATAKSTGALLLQFVGVVLMAGVGVALAWLSYTGQ